MVICATTRHGAVTGESSCSSASDTKEQLFEAAVTEVLDGHGALLDAATAHLHDPAEIFAASFRLTGRLFRTRPQESSVLLANKAGMAAGRFHIEDPELALAMAGGALLGMGKLLQAQPDRDDALAADAVTADVLRLFGMTEQDAREVCGRPLPDLGATAAAS